MWNSMPRVISLPVVMSRSPVLGLIWLELFLVFHINQRHGLKETPTSSKLSLAIVPQCGSVFDSKCHSTYSSLPASIRCKQPSKAAF